MLEDDLTELTITDPAPAKGKAKGKQADEPKIADDAETVTLYYSGEEDLKLYITSPKPLVLKEGPNKVRASHAKRLLKDKVLSKFLSLDD